MKRNKSRKPISLLLAAVMLFCALPAAHAVSPDRCVTMTAGEMNADGMIPIAVTAHDYIGLISFDLQATVEEGVTFLDAAESPDMAETQKTDNFILSCSNPLNGKLCAFFRYELWELDKWQASTKPGQTLSDSFDPNHFVLGVFYVHFGPTANNPSRITLQGTMHYSGGKDPVNLSIQVTHSASAAEETYYVRYNHGNDVYCTGAPTPQEKKAGVDLTLSPKAPTTKYVISMIYNNNVDLYKTKEYPLEFSHWNTREDGKGTNYYPGDVYTDDKDLVLYPQWIAPLAGELPVPEKEGYTFMGWFSDPGFHNMVTEDSIVVKGTHFYARWVAKKGDVNCSDDVTAADARTVLRGAVELETFDAEQMDLADMDGDAAVTAADARLVLRTAVKLDPLKYVTYQYEIEPQE